MDKLMKSMKEYKVCNSIIQLRIKSLIPKNPNNTKISLKSWPKNALNMYRGYTKREYITFISSFIHFYIIYRVQIQCSKKTILQLALSKIKHLNLQGKRKYRCIEILLTSKIIA